MNTVPAVVGDWRISPLWSTRPVRGKGSARVDAKTKVDVPKMFFDRLDRDVQRSGRSAVGVAATHEVCDLVLARGQLLWTRTQLLVVTKSPRHRCA